MCARAHSKASTSGSWSRASSCRRAHGALVLRVVVNLFFCVVVATELEQNEEDAVDRVLESDGARLQAVVVDKASGNESNGTLWLIFCYLLKTISHFIILDI